MKGPKIWTEPEPNWKALVPKGEIDWLMMRTHVATSKRGIIRQLWRRMTSYHDRSYRQFRRECYFYAFAVQHEDKKLIWQLRL
jgi:hypothetical protein